MGNICRSPTAEGVFRTLLERRGLLDVFTVDSAGIGAYHLGEPPDSRTLAAAKRRGYDLSRLRARRVEARDFERFDLILAMDEGILTALQRQCPSDMSHKLALYTDYARSRTESGVPDPYYGGKEDFELVLDIVEDVSPELMASLTRRQNK